MSARLDQSLDEIIKVQRQTSGARAGRRTRRGGAAGRPAAVAPASGVKKTPKQAKGAVKAIPTGPSGASGEGKILISGLPKDVNEAQIKEYFTKACGPIKKAELSYGPGGNSRGIANITFARADSATKAVKDLNGIAVDNKPIKVELIVDANIAKSIPAPKGLSERITQPKPQPKSAAATKTTGSATRGRGKGRGGRGGRNPRPAKKTAEELDSEMADYWQSGNTTTETGGAAAPPAANGDANMEDEVL